MRQGVRPRIPWVVALVLAALSCGGSPWDVKGAPKAPPDEQFRTGVEVGEDVFVWHCYEGSRIVVSQHGSACFGTSRPRIERGACGAPLPGEARFPDVDGGHRGTVPDDYRWPGSKPESP